MNEHAYQDEPRTGTREVRGIDKPQAPIQEYLAYLDESLEELNQSVGDLTMRLDKVLTPYDADATDPEKKDTDAARMRSDLTEKLAVYVSRIHGIRARVNWLEQRVEL